MEENQDFSREPLTEEELRELTKDIDRILLDAASPPNEYHVTL